MACENPIAAARRRLHMSQESLGSLLGVSGRTVSYWERWAKVPDPGRVEAIRKALGLSDVDTWRIANRPAAKALTLTGKRGSIW